MCTSKYVTIKCKLFYINYIESAKKQTLEFDISQHSMWMKEKESITFNLFTPSWIKLSSIFLMYTHSSDSLMVKCNILLPLIVNEKIDLRTWLADNVKKSATSREHRWYLMDNENFCTPRRKPRPRSSAGWMEQRSQKRVHYKAINARYKAVRMRGNYLRTNQPKPDGQRQLSVKKSSTSVRMVLLRPRTSYDIHWELLLLFFSSL